MNIKIRVGEMKEFLCVFIGFVVGFMGPMYITKYGDMSFEAHQHKLDAINKACETVNSEPVLFENSGTVWCKNEAMMKWSVSNEH